MWKQHLGSLEKEKLLKQPKIFLKNADAATGSILLDQPGYYVLEEDIIFRPNPDNDYSPLPSQAKKYAMAFRLGFFAALVVTSPHVVIDLNGHTIRQHAEHALQQRFYANIELGPAPFIPKKGPADFAKHFTPIHHCIVMNGTLGLASHHAIHGNGCQNVLIENVKMQDWEVGSIGINNGTNIFILNCTIPRNRVDVPILGIYSAGRFLRQFLQGIIDSNALPSIQAKGRRLLESLDVEMNQVFVEVMETGKTTHPLFRNPSGCVDGNVYGIVIHGIGPAVDDLQLAPPVPEAKVIVIDHVHLGHIENDVREIVGLSYPSAISGTDTPATSDSYNNEVQHDAAGAVFQVELCGQGYTPNVISEAQLFVAKYKEFSPNGNKSNISQGVLDWASGTISWKQLWSQEKLQYIRNGDSMFHVQKGLMGIRVDEADQVWITNCTMDHLENRGHLGTVAYGDYKTSHPKQRQLGYQGGVVRGICISGSTNVHIHGNLIKTLKSHNSYIRGIDILNQSTVRLDNNQIDQMQLCPHMGNKWLTYFKDKAPSMLPHQVPNPLPTTEPLHISEDSTVYTQRADYLDLIIAVFCLFFVLYYIKK